MAEFVSGVMGAMDVVAGIILLTTGITIVMVLGGFLIGKGIISFF